MSKLSSNQLSALMKVHEHRGIPVDGHEASQYHGNTWNSLFKRGMISITRYANGEYYHITNEGLDEIEEQVSERYFPKFLRT